MAPTRTLFRATAAALAVVVAVVTAAATPSAACSCLPPPPLSEAVAASAVTIRATVTAAVFIPDPLEEQGKDKVYAATVRRSFKGCLPRRIELVSGANSALCGVTLQVGTTYLFVLRAADAAGKYRVSSCDTLRVWSEVSWADRKTLAGANNLVCPRSPWVFGPYAYKK